MDSTKATINTSGLKKIHDITKWLQSLTNKTNCNDKRELANCMYPDRKLSRRYQGRNRDKRHGLETATKTRWKGDEQQKDGLNTERAIVHSS